MFTVKQRPYFKFLKRTIRWKGQAWNKVFQLPTSLAQKQKTSQKEVLPCIHHGSSFHMHDQTCVFGVPNFQFNFKIFVLHRVAAQTHPIPLENNYLKGQFRCIILSIGMRCVLSIYKEFYIVLRPAIGYQTVLDCSKPSCLFLRYKYDKSKRQPSGVMRRP